MALVIGKTGLVCGAGRIHCVACVAKSRLSVNVTTDTQCCTGIRIPREATEPFESVPLAGCADMLSACGGTGPYIQNKRKTGMGSRGLRYLCVESTEPLRSLDDGSGVDDGGERSAEQRRGIPEDGSASVTGRGIPV